jgi:replicative DNA helicase
MDAKQSEPPFSLLAEQIVLGVMMADAVKIPFVKKLVGEHDFYVPQHQLLYRAIVAFNAAGKPTDPASIKRQMGKRVAELNQGIYGDGSEFFAAIAAVLPNADSFEDGWLFYCRIMRDCSMKRILVVLADRLRDRAYCITEKPAEILAALIPCLQKLQERIGK